MTRIIKVKDKLHQKKYTSAAWHIVDEKAAARGIAEQKKLAEQDLAQPSKSKFYEELSGCTTLCLMSLLPDEIEKEVEVGLCDDTSSDDFRYSLCNTCYRQHVYHSDSHQRQMTLAYAFEEFEDVIENLIEQVLTEEEIEIVKSHHGFSTPNLVGMGLHQIAEARGITREQVRQVVHRSMKKLRIKL